MIYMLKLFEAVKSEEVLLIKKQQLLAVGVKFHMRV